MQINADDWSEDFSKENGNYVRQCCICNQIFRGHKRRVVCKVCYLREKLYAEGKTNVVHTSS